MIFILFLFFQADQRNGDAISLTENIASSFDGDVTEQFSIGFNDECEEPLVTFSSTKQEEDVSKGKRDDVCGVDCESFYPADLLSFAWQIARGMVR